MEKKWKKTVIQAAICVGLLCLIWGGYFIVKGKIDAGREEKELKELQVEIDYELLGQVETVNSENGKVTISGWALRKNSRNKNIYLLLRSGDEGEEILIRTGCTERADVDDIMNHEYDFGKTGFTAKIQEKELEKDKSYEILLALEYEEEGSARVQRKITTNRYLYNGELYRYRPEEFVKPEISQTEIKEVIDNGKLYACDVEKGGWIYVHQGVMYWILDEKQFEGLETTVCIPLRIFTPEEEKIPTERKEEFEKKGYDYFELFVKKKYRVSGDKGMYYVVTMGLPEYLISYIRTGSYGNDGVGWLYKAEFQMDITK